MSFELHEECGVFGIFTAEETTVAEDAYYALYALQHRGQESCGIAVAGTAGFRSRCRKGLVSDSFDAQKLRALGCGCGAIGHVLYGKLAPEDEGNIQPLTIDHSRGMLSICNNGALSNSAVLREELEMNGVILHTRSDAELIAALIIRERLRTNSLVTALSETMRRLEGAYTLLILTEDRLIGVRGMQGIRPLCIGRTDKGYALSSESCAFDSIGAEFIRDVKPGEIVIIDKNGYKSVTENCGRRDSALCVFEYVYFSRPDSVVDGVSVHEARKRSGRFLAIDSPCEADVVIGVPDSGLDAAIGYSEGSGIPYEIGFIKNKYIGRTFIQPTQADREDKVRIKLNPIIDVIKGKRVVLVDDSIVRGTTCARIVKQLRRAGATEVHMRASCPPFLHPCYFGTDIGSEKILIAHDHTLEEMRKIIGVDSLAFQRLDRTEEIAKGCPLGLCKGCFTGVYPCQIPKK